VPSRSEPSRRGVAGIVLVVVAFLFAVQLLGAATQASAPVLRAVFVRTGVGDVGALALGWLGTYAISNGSVVAAVAVSLQVADVLSPTATFLAVGGTRLGGAAVVMVVGSLDVRHRKELSLQESMSMGSLTFLLTHLVYVPACVLGYLVLPWVLEVVGERAGVGGLGVGTSNPVSWVTAGIVEFIGPVPSIVLAVAALFASLSLFDSVLDEVDVGSVADVVFEAFERRWVAVLAGMVVSAGTTSVAFSLGVVVPLYNRGYVTRERLVPYVLGANVGTLVDTVAVAVLLESSDAVVSVLVLVVVAAVTTAAFVVGGEVVESVVLAVEDRLQSDTRVFVAFLVALVLVPLGLLAMAVGV
jgi:sodium-dependent phosphate cotransporter